MSFSVCLSLSLSLSHSVSLSLSHSYSHSLSFLLSLSPFLTLSLSCSLPFLLSHPNPASLHLINTRNEQEALERANAKAVQDENDAQQERQIELAKLKSQRAKREILNARKAAKNADIKGQPVESQTAAATASHAKHVSHSTTAPVPVLLVHINLLCVYV
jgi:hypothetical protein